MLPVLNCIHTAGGIGHSLLVEMYENTTVKQVASTIQRLVNDNYEALILCIAATQFFEATSNFVLGSIIGSILYNQAEPFNMRVSLSTLFEHPLAKSIAILFIIVLRLCINVPALVTGYLFACFI